MRASAHKGGGAREDPPMTTTADIIISELDATATYLHAQSEVFSRIALDIAHPKTMRKEAAAQAMVYAYADGRVREFTGEGPNVVEHAMALGGRAEGLAYLIARGLPCHGYDGVESVDELINRETELVQLPHALVENYVTRGINLVITAVTESWVIRKALGE